MLGLLLQRHIQAALYSLKVLIAKPFSLALTVAVIAIALTIPCLFWMMSNNLEAMTGEWQTQSDISMYLSVPMEEAQMRQTLQAVQNIPGVKQARLKTPIESLKLLESQEGMGDIMRHLPSNPLPALIEVTPKIEEASPLKMNQLAARLKALPGVDQVKIDMDWIKRLHAILGVVRALVKGMLILLALGVSLIIGNTLRLALNTRIEEIRVLKLMGATHSYIMRPFLYLGIWYGVLGALVSILFVSLFLFSLTGAIDKLVAVYQMHYPFLGLTVLEAYLLVFFSAALGWAAAQAFVRRQLSTIEPG